MRLLIFNKVKNQIKKKLLIITSKQTGKKKIYFKKYMKSGQFYV